MSNIRPIGDPAIATAMLATMQSIDAVRSPPSGISEPRWRILQCIAKAAPNVPTPGELRMCSGLNKAALAEHVQALQWKGLLEMGGYRLSPSAAEMVGIAQPYPPKDAKAMVIVEHGPRDADAVVALQHAIAAMGIKDMSILPPEPVAPVFIGVDIAVGPDVSIEARVTFGADGKIAKIEPLTPMDPADVPACLRPDCMPPERPIAEVSNEEAADRLEQIAAVDGARGGVSPGHGAARSDDTGTDDAAAPSRGATPTADRVVETNRHGRGGAAVAHPIQGEVHRDRVASDRALRTPEEVAGSNPVPGQPSKPQISVPPATPPKFTNWIEQRQARIAGAIAFLGSLGIPVAVADRSAEIRTYFVSANRRSLFAEEVIEFAIEKGWAE